MKKLPHTGLRQKLINGLALAFYFFITIYNKKYVLHNL